MSIFFVNFFKTFTKQNQHSIIFFFGQTPGSKWTVSNDFLAEKEQILYYEGLRPIAASIEEGLPVLRLTITMHCTHRNLEAPNI